MVFPTGSISYEFEQGMLHLEASRYLCAAALVLSIYDWLLLIGQESQTIWKGRWTLPKTIYYFNRVITSLGLAIATYHLTDLRTVPLSTRFCQIYTFVNSFVELFSFFLANWLLTLRLVALYKRKRAIVWFLYSFLIVSYLVTAGIMLFTLYTYGLSIHYSIELHACGSTTRSPLMPAIFFAPAAFEVTIFALTGYRAWRDAKLMTSTSNAPFLTILYRDGIICFFIMFGVRMWNVWIYATQPLTTVYLGIYMLWATMTLLSTRVYLNLVYLAHGQTQTTSTSVSAGALPPRFVGIRMRVQTTTFADPEHVLTFENTDRRRDHQLDTSFRLGNATPNSELPWEGRSSKEGRTSPRDSLDERPFSSKSYASDSKVQEKLG